MPSSISNSDDIAGVVDQASPATAIAPPPEHHAFSRRHLRSVNFKTELKTLLVVLLVFVGFELRTRFVSPREVTDRYWLRTFPAKAKALEAKGGTRVLLVGNSLVRNGYKIPVMEEALTDTNKNFHFEAAALYGSSLTEWYHLFKTFYLEDTTPPTALVVNLSPGSAADTSPENLRTFWFAEESHFTDLPDILLHDCSNIEERGDVLRGWLCMSYAYRNDIIKPIADCWQGTNWVNDHLNAAAKKRPPKPYPLNTYVTLHRLGALAAEHHVRVLVVLMPTREYYEIDPKLPAEVQSAGMELLDLRRVPGITKDFFEDGWHLNKEGGIFFSKYMAQELPKKIDEMLSHPAPPVTADR